MIESTKEPIGTLDTTNLISEVDGVEGRNKKHFQSIPWEVNLKKFIYIIFDKYLLNTLVKYF